MDNKQDEKRTVNCSATLVALTIAAVSSLVTLLLANHFYNGQACDALGNRKALFGDTKVNVIRTTGDRRCYIKPDENSPAQKFSLVSSSLSDEVVEQIAGTQALEFCRHHETFLLRTSNTASTRRKRATMKLEPSIHRRMLQCTDVLVDCGNGKVAGIRSCNGDGEEREEATQNDDTRCDNRQSNW